MNPHPSLGTKDLAMFARHKIPAKLVAEAGIRRVTETEARQNKIRAPKNIDLSGVLFPYPDIESGEIFTCRLRRDNPEKDKDGKLKNKYLMPPAESARRILYYSPGSAEKLKRDVPIVLVEAEKSALALTAWSARVKLPIAPLGMGGCWGWSQNKKMMPDMSVCDCRRVFVLLDAADNENVRQAQDQLV